MPRLGRERGTGRLPCTGYSAEPRRRNDPGGKRVGKNVPGGGNSLCKGLGEHKKARSQDSGADSSWSLELESLRARLKLRVSIATGDSAG